MLRHPQSDQTEDALSFREGELEGLTVALQAVGLEEHQLGGLRQHGPREGCPYICFLHSHMPLYMFYALTHALIYV